MIAIGPLLHEIIPHGWHRIALMNPDCSIIAAYAENADAYAIFRERLWKYLDDPKALVSVVLPSFHAIGIGWSLHRQGAGYLESEYYRETEAVIDSCWILDAMVGYEGQTVAGLQLTRPRSARPFTTDDLQRLDRLRPWLGHALRGNCAEACAERPASGFTGAPLLRGQMILAPGMKSLFQSSEMEFLRLVMDGLSYNTRAYGMERFRWNKPREIPAPIQKLVRRLVDAADGVAGPPPRMRLSTAYGLAELEAKWLAPAETSPEEVARDPKSCLVSITIDLHEHGVAHAARVLRDGGATPAQARVGISLALGKTKPAIAKELGIQISSVEDLTKKLYRRLDIHNLSDLGIKLWTESGSKED